MTIPDQIDRILYPVLKPLQNSEDEGVAKVGNGLLMAMNWVLDRVEVVSDRVPLSFVSERAIRQRALAAYRSGQRENERTSTLRLVR